MASSKRGQAFRSPFLFCIGSRERRDRCLFYARDRCGLGRSSFFISIAQIGEWACSFPERREPQFFGVHLLFPFSLPSIRIKEPSAGGRLITDVRSFSLSPAATGSRLFSSLVRIVELLLGWPGQSWPPLSLRHAFFTPKIDAFLFFFFFFFVFFFIFSWNDNV